MIPNNIAALRKRAGLSQTELAERMGTKLSMLGKLERGDRGLTSDWIGRAAQALSVPPSAIIGGEAGPRADVPDRPPTRSSDPGETAVVMRLDLSYAMGPGTNLDDDHVEGEPVIFDLAFLRLLTPSPAENLRIVNGSGDSMLPTIHDREELIIDTAQRRLNMQDRIWAISLFGAGALKRLRMIGQGRVLVISDNPDVEDQEVDAGDIYIAGRLVGSIKRH